VDVRRTAFEHGEHVFCMIYDAVYPWFAVWYAAAALLPARSWDVL
jgi:hypothetical protein